MLLKNYYNNETKTLSIPSSFNEELKDIPEETEIIIFEEKHGTSSKFNKKINTFPKNLTHLTFGCRFNQNVDNLPAKLTYLTFGIMFNQKIDYLPQSLIQLYFLSRFNKKYYICQKI